MRIDGMSITQRAESESIRLHALINQQTAQVMRYRGDQSFGFWKVAHLTERVGRIDRWLKKRLAGSHQE